MPFDSIVILAPHPASPPPADVGVSVEVRRGAHGDLDLVYRIRAADHTLRLPARRTPVQADGLWQHTCCEAFVATTGQTGYTEFNFSPSGCWAGYAFADYRVRAPHDPRIAPVIDFAREAGAWVLKVRLDRAVLPDSDAVMALSCVLEDARGECSFWAMRHPGRHPDFHHRDGFALTLNKEAAA